jgi:rhodanese-related sulfurtransferase
MSNDDKLRHIEAMYEKARRAFPDVPEVTVAELLDLQTGEEIVIVDVRSPPEQAVSMIPGAITSSDFEANRQRYEGRTVVTYCTIGGRSGRFAQALRAQGWNAHNLRGSILAWTHGGGPLVDAEGPTRRINVHGSRYDLAAEGYETVW